MWRIEPIAFLNSDLLMFYTRAKCDVVFSEPGLLHLGEWSTPKLKCHDLWQKFHSPRLYVQSFGLWSMTVLLLWKIIYDDVCSRVQDLSERLDQALSGQTKMQEDLDFKENELEVYIRLLSSTRHTAMSCVSVLVVSKVDQHVLLRPYRFLCFVILPFLSCNNT